MGIFKILLAIITMLSAQFKKATSTIGITETKEFLIGLNEIGVFLAGKFKDGVQITDFTEFYAELMSNEEFKAKIQSGYDNAKQIPSEIKDIDAGEGLELAGVQIEYVEKYVDVLKS